MSVQAILDQLADEFLGTAACPATPAGWGAGAWGGSGWGGASGAPADLCLAFALAIRENVVRLFFSEAVKFTRHGDPGDGSALSNYVVQAESGTGIDGLPVRPVATAAVELVPDTGNRQIDVITDRPFSPFGTAYRVTVNNLQAESGKLLRIGANSLLFDGVQQGLPVLIPDLAIATRDIANPQTRSALYDPLPEAGTGDDALLATYQYDAQGDVAFDEGLVSFKKRVFRRLSFRRNRTGHLQGYGVGVPDSVKRLALPGVRNSLAQEAEEQIRQEPETVDVSVSVDVNPNGVAFYRIRIKTNIGRTVNFAAPVAFSPTEESSA